MKHLLIIFTTLFLCLFMTNCGNDNPVNYTKENSLASLYPFLKLGNSFVYRTDSLNANTTDTFTFYSIEKRETLSYKAEAFYTITNKDTTDTEIWGYVWSDSAFSIGNDFRIGVFPLCPHHCSIGITWTYTRPSSSRTYTRTILSTTDKIDVPAGIFDNCIHIQHTVSDSDIIEDYWFRKDIGVIKFKKTDGSFVELCWKNY